jgi:hypothetical protein
VGRIAVRAIILAVLVSIGAMPIAAQDRPPPAAEVAVGSTGFADDGTVWERFLGAAGRFYVSPRLAIGPEISHIQGTRHSHLILTGNLTFDLLRPVNGRPAPIGPFLVAGGGLFRTREIFPNGPFSSGEGAFTAGGGVRGRIADRFYVGGDVRIGWETHIRFNAVVGLQF